MSKPKDTTWLWPLCLALLAALLVAGPAPIAAADDHDEDEEREVERERDRDRDEDEWEEEEEEWEAEIEGFILEIELYERLLGLVNELTTIVNDPTKSAIAAVMAVEDHVDEPEDEMRFLEGMLNQTRNAAVKRAIRIKLIDLYGEEENQKKALDQIRRLILEED